jgi:hypothetical protein
MSRRRLEAEAIRDSLLLVAGNLTSEMGGPAFTPLDTPRRTIYLMSARTGANTSGFASLFDRADPGSIVEKRTVSTIAPQALLNDPFVSAQAKGLADRLKREAGKTNHERIRRLYDILFGRPARPEEEAVGLDLLAPAAGEKIDPLERYCLTVLCANEFLYVD